jgi:hypothetical protein
MLHHLRQAGSEGSPAINKKGCGWLDGAGTPGSRPLIWEGFKNPEVGEQLRIGVKTVEAPIGRQCFNPRPLKKARFVYGCTSSQ